MQLNFKRSITLFILSLTLFIAQAQVPVEVKDPNPRPAAKKPAEKRDAGGKVIQVPIGTIPKEKGTIFFDKTRLDFGVLEEENGIQYVIFSFANIGKGDLKVIEVHASCGCTTPEWSKGSLRTNETGYIKVGFSPKGQAGHFSKSLTVTTNGDPVNVYLEISGEVKGTTQDWHVKTPMRQGNTRVSSNVITMRPVKQNRKDSILFNFYNSSTSDIDIFNVTLPSYLELKPVPKFLAAGDGKNMYIYFKPNSGAQFGPNEDEMLIPTSDDSLPLKTFIIKTMVEEDFSAVSPEEKKNPPMIRFEEKVFDFGEVYLSELVKHDFVITNKGKSDLHIRRAYGSCGCTVASVPKGAVKKGQKDIISVTLNAKKLYGPLEKEVTVISNDPEQPITILKVKANVIDPSRTR